MKFIRRFYVARLARKTYLTAAYMLNHVPDALEGVVGRVMEENPDLEPTTESALIEFSRQVRHSGGRFVLSAVPSKFRLTGHQGKGPEFTGKVKAFVGSHDMEYLDLAFPFKPNVSHGAKPIYASDIHLNECGRLKVAEAILIGVLREQPNQETRALTKRWCRVE